MKTIKQIADEIGVSKTAVRKKIDILGLWSGLRKSGNQFLIDENQEKRIKTAFGESHSETDSQTSSHTESETVSALVSMLKNELDKKNEQIANLERLLDQEQHLRMVTEKKLLQIEEKKTYRKWRFFGNKSDE